MRRAPRSAEEQARYQEARQRAHDNWGRVLGVLIVPGGRIWRRSPAIGAALLIAGVVAPVFALGMVVKNRNDLTGFVNSGTTLRWLGVVGVFHGGSHRRLSLPVAVRRFGTMRRWR